MKPYKPPKGQTIKELSTSPAKKPKYGKKKNADSNPTQTKNIHIDFSKVLP